MEARLSIEKNLLFAIPVQRFYIVMANATIFIDAGAVCGQRIARKSTKPEAGMSTVLLHTCRLQGSIESALHCSYLFIRLDYTLH
jgi:hypothetical protein